jgi:hypothetical protein
MTSEERSVCYGLVITAPSGKPRITKEEFLRRFPSSVEDDKLASGLLEKAYKERNHEDLGCALLIGLTFGFAPKQTDLLCSLLEADWHQSHEDIVGILADLRAPNAVGALERTAHALYEYLDYDEFFGLARKCTWALADIATPEAHQALTRLAASDNSLIAGYARKRLATWQTESHRKGAGHQISVRRIPGE